MAEKNIVDLSAKIAEKSASQTPAPPGVLDELILRDTKGVPRACEHNAAALIASSHAWDGLYHDAFRDRIMLGEQDWTDADDRYVLSWLQSNFNYRFSPRMVHSAVMLIAERRQTDRLRSWLEALPKWDDVFRIEQAFHDGWGVEDSEFSRRASRNLFLAMVARALRPGVQVDNVWVFEGAQGIFKSRALRALGGEFHSEITAGVGTADFMRQLRGCWLAELSELDALRGREAATIKHVLSSPTDRFVQKYALHAQSYPRRCVLAATTNEHVYWEDSTGARRLIPVKCGHIDVDLIAENRVRWFAEALIWLETDAKWWDFSDAAPIEQEERFSVDPWEEQIKRFMAAGRTVRDNFGTTILPWPQDWISTAELMSDWLTLPASQQGRMSGVRVSKVMRRLGFIPERRGTPQQRGWVDINESQKKLQV